MNHIATTALSLGLGLLFGSAAMAAPAHRHDGTWQVQLVTESGICGTNTYAITVERGNVRYQEAPGASPAVINGQIAASGAIRLDIRSSAAQGQASGSLSGQSGSGIWKVDSYGCSGHWSAQKRSA